MSIINSSNNEIIVALLLWQSICKELDTSHIILPIDECKSIIYAYELNLELHGPGRWLDYFHKLHVGHQSAVANRYHQSRKYIHERLNQTLHRWQLVPVELFVFAWLHARRGAVHPLRLQ